mgnify:FL=1|nr:MAG TPA: hypothetical protein [Caudoviricetes sp.]
MITNNVDFYQYMMNRGVPCTYMVYPPDYYIEDDLVVVFPTTHNMTVCGNRFNKEKEAEYRRECDMMIDWLECGNKVICITPVIKFDSEYMKHVATKQYKRLQGVNYHKQVIHTKDIGELLVPHKLQIRYVGIEPIEFDIVDTHMTDPKYYWLVNDNVFKPKSMQQHYMNVINASRDTETRRKLRYIPEYTLFSQLYKKLDL